MRSLPVDVGERILWTVENPCGSIAAGEGYIDPAWP